MAHKFKLQRRFCLLFFISAGLILLYSVFSYSNDLNTAATLYNNRYSADSIKTIAFGTRVFFSSQWYDANTGDILDCAEPCIYSDDLQNADAVLFALTDIYHTAFFHLFHPRKSPNQIWAIHCLESPWSLDLYGNLAGLNSYFNLFEGYQRDADFTNPYGWIRPLSHAKKEEFSLPTIEHKTDSVLAMISRCGDAGSGRWSYIQELRKHISVTVYGKCGKSCADPETCNWETLGHRFKFYLAFENSLCRDYITEKFWHNGLSFNMLPIVLGGISKDDYLQVAPPHSFIHVYDFKSPQQLATYLHYLDTNHTAYMEYFQWKQNWVVVDGYLPMSKRFCGLCDYLNNQTRSISENPTSSVSDRMSFENQCAKFDSMHFM